jgi:metal-responsive CopG/Arc/MetJ family transcriptional regulator
LAAIKTAVSVPEAVLEQAEALTHDMEVPRSRLFTLALQEYVKREETRRITQALNEVYSEPPDEEEKATLRQMWQLFQEVLRNEDVEWRTEDVE